MTKPSLNVPERMPERKTVYRGCNSFIYMWLQRGRENGYRPMPAFYSCNFYKQTGRMELESSEGVLGGLTPISWKDILKTQQVS
jgi:hypothetical protein